ncbi:lysine--tRNA ligase [Candidatus Riesia sp. GBBU]|nr:lysine--tRNA ligase [Candidatus Riesia sp. GBBU]
MKENNVKKYFSYFEYEIKNRKKKLLKLRKSCIAFPNLFKRNALFLELNKKYKNKDNKSLSVKNKYVSVAGRIIRKRSFKNSFFIVLQDMSDQIQIYIPKEISLNKEKISILKILDLGDILGVKGKLFKTKTNELTIRCHEICLLTKSLRPLPEKFHGMKDKEIKYRKRYLDLICNRSSKSVFIFRSNLIYFLRDFMRKKNFLEVETPMMQSIPGGAIAKPFITYHNYVKSSMYLRISPELYLKRLVIGGIEKVFEINRNFRNEGISSFHNPEFTMLELYSAYTNYNDLMQFTEELLRKTVKNLLKKTIVSYRGFSLNFDKPFIRMTMRESILHYLPNLRENDLEDVEKIGSIAESLKISKKDNIRSLQYKIFESIVSNQLIQPTFITEYPVEVSPLARRMDYNNCYTERFEIFIGGKEIGNGFSELNDSEDQLNRFVNQKLSTENSENFNYIYDKDYIESLEYGLPPTSGLGIGIDRIAMILTNSKNIRDVILFPTLKKDRSK